MATVQVSERAIRDWARIHGHQVGDRGPISGRTLEEYRAYQEMSCQEKVLRLERRIEQLNAERSEDKAIIASYKSEVERLRGELQSAKHDRDYWKAASIRLAVR